MGLLKQIAILDIRRLYCELILSLPGEGMFA